MSFFDRFLSRKSSLAVFLPDAFRAPASHSGARVSVQTALEVTTVLACARVCANGVAQVPLRLFRERKTGGSDLATDHPLYWLLYRRPNAWQTSFEFRVTMIFHLMLTNNFFAFKNRAGGKLRELIPIEPGCVSVERQTDMTLLYRITGADGSSKVFKQEDIWHVRGPSWNSWMGLEAVKLAREAIGLAIATEHAHAKLHANSSQSGGLYSVEGKLTPERYETLRAWIVEQTTGANKFMPFVLDNNGKFTPTMMTGVDAQHLETRRFQIEEICRALNVQPIMVGYTDKATTYASVEQMMIAHIVHTLSPWYENIEQSIAVNLLDYEAEPDIYAKFNINALLRGSVKDRGQFYKDLYSVRAINPNGIRELEDWNPYDGGEEYAPVGTPLAAAAPANPVNPENANAGA